MPDGFVNLQTQLRAVQDDGVLPLGTLRGGMQRHTLLSQAPGVTGQIERLDQLVTLQHVLPAEAVGIGALLNFRARKTGGHDSRAGLHLDLMNGRAARRSEELLDAAKRHRSFCNGDALHAAHLLVRGQQHVNLTLDGNAEGIFQKRILPGVHVGRFGRERHVFALGERRGLGDGHRFGRAGLHAFAGEAVGRGKAPSAACDHANADAQRLRFREGAHFAVFHGDVAVANVHYARVGIGSAAALGGVEREIG